MKEQLISFKVAKLAKEKGFKLPLRSNGLYFSEMGYIYPYDWFKPENLKDYVDAPTQSLLQKWLREIHLIDMEIRKDDEGKYTFWIWLSSIGKEHKTDITWNTYEEALENGLYDALNLLP